MGKTIFFNIPATGHINPSLPVIRELVQRGTEVIYVNSESMREKCASTGARFIAYPDPGAAEKLVNEPAEQINIAHNMLELVRVSARIFPFVRDLIAQEKPDYILFDSLASWGRMGAKHAHLKSASLVTTFAISPQAMPLKPGIVLDMLGKLARVAPQYLLEALRIRREIGVFPVALMDAVACYGDLNLVFTSAAFQPGAASFGDSFRFVGPAIAARPDDSPFPWETLTAKPLVYISLGTISRSIAFYRTCFEAFADHSGQFILSVGKTDLAALSPIPANFIVRQHVPQLDILQRVDAFITHGGLNSVQEGLWYGVPLVVVPQQVEQAIVAGQVEQSRAGVALRTAPPFNNLSAAELQAGLARVLQDPAVKVCAAALGDTLRAAGGATRAADEIMRFIGDS